MSTVKNNLPAQRIMTLARSEMPLWHANEIGVAWNISNANTLRTTLKRYHGNGLLYRLYRGFYSTVPASKLDSWLLGARALHTYSYVSTETVLFKDGIINQLPNAVTLVSSISRRFAVAGQRFVARKMRDDYLFNDAGITVDGYVRVATTERAVADMLYYNPRASIDGAKLVDWNAVHDLSEEIGYSIDTPTKAQC